MANQSIKNALQQMWKNVLQINSKTGLKIQTHMRDFDNPHNVTIDQIGAEASGAANTALENANAYTDTQLSNLVGDTSVANQISNAIVNKIDNVGITTAGTGTAYTATVASISELTAGVSFIMIPHVVSASTAPTLDVNGLGAKTLKRRLSNMATAKQAGYNNTWLAANIPFRVTYDGTDWIVEGQTKPAVADLYGTLAIDKGGTGATTAEQARINLGIQTSDGTTTSGNADYAEVGEWADGNTNDEDRIGYFVAIDEATEGTTMVKAISTSDVRGVTVAAPAFSGNCSDDKFDENGNLLKQYDYVAVMGIVSIIDNGTCTVNGRCMPNDDGIAVPSTNNMGYQVFSRIDSTHILIAVEPGADMLNRIKDDMVSKADASDVSAHVENDDIHVTSDEKIAWNSKANASDVSAHISNTTVHITADERTAWNNKADSSDITALSALVGDKSVLTQISDHNTSTSTHGDIRDLIAGLTTRLNALADSDDITLDQLSEIVAYIKSNRNLIEGVTTNKVNVSDIIDNLTTNISNKPLSAAQGVALKLLIDALQTTKANTDLSNIDNATFKAKAEASGFSGGSAIQILTWEEVD